jgi:KDO2-lipid IV(A) lauroyltransferase
MKLSTKAGYYAILISCKLVGLLPAWFLYHVLTDVIYFIFYKILRYRVKVVRDNLSCSFPDKSTEELRRIERGFYRNLSEIVVDSVDLASISEKQLRKRMVFDGVAQHEEAVAGKNWIAALAHYGSWEYFSAYQFYTASQVVGVYKSLHSKAFEAYYMNIRSRFGAAPVEMNALPRYVAANAKSPRKLAIGMIADQTPPMAWAPHWCQFLGRQTSFHFGIEKIAIKYKMPVYFMRVEKSSRAHYKASFELIFDGEEDVASGVITERYARKLEAMIQETPELWMWSHRRWKHRPEDWQKIEENGKDRYVKVKR